ncbi:MAG: hypothetical protein ACOWWM_18835 [Desulfobacterales bacterium]
MKYPVKILLMIASAALMAGLTASMASGAAPSARIPEPVFSFEPVIEGEHVVHDFVIRNEGDAPLRIHKVGTT